MQDKPAGTCAWQACANAGTQPVSVNATLRTWLDEPWHSATIESDPRHDPLAPKETARRRVVMLCRRHADEARPLLEINDESEE